MGGADIDASDHGHVRAVLVRTQGHELALAVDEFLGTQEIVLKSLGTVGEQLAGVAGATILGDGTVALVVDVERVVEQDPMGTRVA
jgi:chemotaxis protein histidine kinase CheA